MDRFHLNEKMGNVMNGIQIGNMIWIFVQKHITINNSVWKCRKWETEILCNWDLMAHWIIYSAREPLSIEINAWLSSRFHSRGNLWKSRYFLLWKRCIVCCIHRHLVTEYTTKYGSCAHDPYFVVYSYGFVLFVFTPILQCYPGTRPVPSARSWGQMRSGPRGENGPVRLA